MEFKTIRHHYDATKEAAAWQDENTRRRLLNIAAKEKRLEAKQTQAKKSSRGTPAKAKAKARFVRRKPATTDAAGTSSLP